MKRWLLTYTPASDYMGRRHEDAEAGIAKMSKVYDEKATASMTDNLELRYDVSPPKVATK